MGQHCSKASPGISVQENKRDTKYWRQLCSAILAWIIINTSSTPTESLISVLFFLQCLVLSWLQTVAWCLPGRLAREVMMSIHCSAHRLGDKGVALMPVACECLQIHGKICLMKLLTKLWFWLHPLFFKPLLSVRCHPTVNCYLGLCMQRNDSPHEE